MDWSTSNEYESTGEVRLVSNECSQALAHFFSSPSVLAVATEASSHPSGLPSLYAQPYVYGGGGLGNIDECNEINDVSTHGNAMHVCLAGGTRRDSLTFASTCVPKACDALDLQADDFLATLTLASQAASKKSRQLSTEYTILHQRIAELNKFLKTGWTCGEYKVEFNKAWGSLYVVTSIILVGLTIMATCGPTIRRPRPRQSFQQPDRVHHADSSYGLLELEPSDIDDDEDEAEDEEEEEEEEKKAELLLIPLKTDGLSQKSSPATAAKDDQIPPQLLQQPSSLLSAWNLETNLQQLLRRRPDTACLDGLRVLSILWVILGHVMAIQSSSGGGYNNPADFLPPQGLTTTLGGQLLFSARFAVDTFLLISGYLVVTVLLRMPRRTDIQWYKCYCRNICGLVLGRLLRIFPLYIMMLGFWIYIAPHLGGGPFWYQWQPMLDSCAQYGWTNLLFVNNFFPLDLANTQTCFYHSWYLAVDLQLFLLAPLLIYLYQDSARAGIWATAALCFASIAATCYLTFSRQWSINTFDGAAVVRFDIQGYAKPHVRAQAYLAGMTCCMLLTKWKQRRQHQEHVASRRKQNHAPVATTWKHHLLMATAIAALLAVTFITVTGAYARRPCRYEENPAVVECGSTWSATSTFVYTGLGRAFWAISISVVMGLCLLGRGGWINSFLSLGMWTPLAHLSFGAYLIHPIVIFVWQLGDRQKESFRLLVFGTNYVSVVCVSFVGALAFILIVEFPCARLVKNFFSSRRQEHRQQEQLIQSEPVHYGSLNKRKNHPWRRTY